MLVAALVTHPAASALAAFTAPAAARGSIQSLVLEPPAAVTATTSDGCARVTIAWSAAPAADSYRVDVRTGDGAWVELSPDTGPVTSVEDTAGHAGTTVAYRVQAGDSGSGWHSAAAVESNQLSC